MPSRSFARRGSRAALLGGILVSAAALCAAPRGAAGDPPKPAPAPKEELATITISDQQPLEDLLKSLMIAEKKAIVWQSDDKAITTKKLTPAQVFTAPKGKLFDTVRALLSFEEVVLIPIGPPGFEIYVAMDARALQSQFILKNKPLYIELTDQNVSDYENQDGLYVATTIKVFNMENLRDARQALQRIITQNNIGSVQEVAAARAFVVTDFAPNVAAIYRLIKQMDVQPQGKKLRQEYIFLKSALAEDIEPILLDLFTGKQRLAQGGPNPPGGDIIDPEPKIISDARTNQIIVYATEDDVKEIKALVEHLDTALIYPTQFVHVKRLKNLEAAATAQVLTSLIDGTSLFGSSSGGFSSSSRTTGRRSSSGRSSNTPSPRPGGTTNPNIATSPDQQEKPTVVADEASNSLIIAASKSQYDQLELIIDQIDIRKKQVLIEAALIELSLNDSFQFALELGALDDNGLKPHGSPSAFGGTSFGLTEFADRNGDGIFTDRVPPYISKGGAGPTGLIGGIFAGGQVPLIYHALDTVKRTRVLQLPSIVAADNQDATIKVLDEQAVTNSTVTSGGNTNAGFGGFQEAGTTLSISPHIAEDNYLLLNINLEVSGFLGNPKTVGTTQIPADKFDRQIQTSVTLPDRHTVVLGGLLGTTQRSTVDQVPFLGELPIIGNLFKGTDKTDIQTNLFLFVTPTILRNDNFSDFDQVTCLRKQKADDLVGELDIPFSNFVGCRDRCAVDPATGRLRGSGSASDRLDRLGVLDATQFRGVDPNRLAAEAQARQRAMMGVPASAPARSGR